MTDEKEYMTDKKLTFCDKGSLKVIVRTQGHGSWKNNDEMFLNANDHVVGNNILCYGYCKCLGGICRPHTPKVWIYTDEKSLIGGAPKLTQDSRLFCMHGGVISFSDGKINGPIDCYTGMNNNKWVAGVIDTSSGILGIMGSAALLFGSEFTLGISAIAGAYGLVKSSSDLVNGVGELCDAAFGTNVAHDYLKESVVYLGNKTTSMDKETVALVYDTGNALSGKMSGQTIEKIVFVASKQKDYSGVIDDAVKIREKYESVYQINDDYKYTTDKNISDVVNELGNFNH